VSAPLVINLMDGSVWERRAVTGEGVALYALAGSCKCPEFVMATESELAALGIAGSADVLPVRVGPVLRSRSVLDRAREALGARMAKDDLRLVLENVIGYAAGLELERRSTNEALDDAVRELRARQGGGCSCPPAGRPHQVGCPLDGVPVAGPSEWPVNELTAAYMPVASLREDAPLKGRARLDASAAADAEATHWKRLGIEDPHDGPLARTYRLSHDLPEAGGR
jgi:hypothetical protein